MALGGRGGGRGGASRGGRGRRGHRASLSCGGVRPSGRAPTQRAPHGVGGWSGPPARGWSSPGRGGGAGGVAPHPPPSALPAHLTLSPQHTHTSVTQTSSNDNTPLTADCSYCLYVSNDNTPLTAESSYCLYVSHRNVHC